jgi:SAM-dependent methyltransferase
MPVNYDARLHRVYAEGRKLAPETLSRWIAEFERHAPRERPLRVLDLGSGTGRFTPALADTFGGPVYGVEPSERMRAVARSGPARPDVEYRNGTAEAIPLADASCDLALLYFTFHHFTNQPAALAELARVLRPGAVLLLRSAFADRMPPLHWYRYFPSAAQADAAMYGTLAEVRRMVGVAGFTSADLVAVDAGQPQTLRATYERLNWRALSTFEHLAEDEIESGFAEFARDAETRGEEIIPATPADLLVLHRD